MWEDEGNKNGGKISLKLKKDYTTIIWEEMILAVIGGVLPQVFKDEVNGVVVSIRKEYNVLQIWFKSYTATIISDLEY
jgi:translation initiation factor 4E